MRPRVAALAAATTLALTLAAGGHARAEGVYFSEAAGASTIKDELGDYGSDGVRIRLALGYRVGDWSLETFLAPEFTFNQYRAEGPSLLGYGVDVKRIFKVSPHASLYVRGSMSRLIVPDQGGCYDCTWNSPLNGYSGRGLGGGVGAQISGKVPVIGLLAWPLFFTNAGPKMTGALFIEDSYDFYRLQPPRNVLAIYQPAIDASISRWTIGFAFGSDF